MKTKNNTQFPQTVEIPQPLEVHPSVDPELARGLMAACEYIAANPEKFNMTEGRLTANGVGCVICHTERLSSWRRPTDCHCGTTEGEVHALPLGHALRIYSPFGWNEGNSGGAISGWNFNEPRIARIEHFLRTGE